MTPTKKVIVENGEGREVNPQLGNSDIDYVKYGQFEATVQKYRAPNIPDGEHWCRLGWQQSDEDGDGNTVWRRCYNPMLATSDTRQVWILAEEVQKEESQPDREGRCMAECEMYYCGLIPKQSLEWFRKGVEIGAKWVDSGDKIII